MNNVLKKILKGTIAIIIIKVIFVSVIFTLQSCKKDDIKVFQEKNNFLNSLELSSEIIKDFSINNPVSKSSNKSKTDTDIICLKLSDLTLQDDFLTYANNMTNLNDVVTAKDSFGATSKIFDNSNELDDDCVFQIEIPTQPIIDILDLTVQDAKDYLMTKGFTNTDIDNMLLDENGTDLDLIPLVMTLISIEDADDVAFNYTNIFIQSAYSQTWADVGNCAMAAIGVDILWALGTSSASAWTMFAIKKAFGTVAKKMLGPIGVAIAVVSFGLCMYQAHQKEITDSHN